jgi:hypothetical protein
VQVVVQKEAPFEKVGSEMNQQNNIAVLFIYFSAFYNCIFYENIMHKISKANLVLTKFVS